MAGRLRPATGYSQSAGAGEEGHTDDHAALGRGDRRGFYQRHQRPLRGDERETAGWRDCPRSTTGLHGTLRRWEQQWHTWKGNCDGNFLVGHSAVPDPCNGRPRTDGRRAIPRRVRKRRGPGRQSDRSGWCSEGAGDGRPGRHQQVGGLTRDRRGGDAGSGGAGPGSSSPTPVCGGPYAGFAVVEIRMLIEEERISDHQLVRPAARPATPRQER